MLGAAYIARKAVLPAIAASSNGTVVALASRAPDRARQALAPYPASRACDSYESLLEQADVDAVYIPLVNSMHAEWSIRALRAGKHVLCEKPLAMSAHEAATMAAAAYESGRLLMEASMYRFHPAMQEFVASVRDPLHVHATFGFTLADAGNYRMRSALGGGALLDVGCYTVSACRWLLGEPERVTARMRVEGGTDLSTAALLEFSGGRTASVFASFETPEEQILRVVGKAAVYQRVRPFTAWRDPWDPYQLMVESFADSALGGRPVALPPEDSIANLAVLDRIREAARG